MHSLMHSVPTSGARSSPQPRSLRGSIGQIEAEHSDIGMDWLSVQPFPRKDESRTVVDAGLKRWAKSPTGQHGRCPPLTQSLRQGIKPAELPEPIRGVL